MVVYLVSVSVLIELLKTGILSGVCSSSMFQSRLESAHKGSVKNVKSSLTPTDISLEVSLLMSEMLL